MREDKPTTRREARLKAKAVQRVIENNDGTTFLRLPHAVLDSPGYRLAEHVSRSLLIDLAGQLRRRGCDGGQPNGALMVAPRERMAALGWTSQDVIRRALRDLIECGLIVETRKGHKHLPGLYAVTWAGLDIDGAQYRLDINGDAWDRVHRGGYMQPAKQRRGRSDQTANATAARQAKNAERAPSDGIQGVTIAPSDGAPASAGGLIAPSHGAFDADSAPLIAPSDGASIEPLPYPGSGAEVPSTRPPRRPAPIRGPRAALPQPVTSP